MIRMGFAIVGFIFATSTVTQASGAWAGLPSLVGAFRASTNVPSVIENNHSFFLDNRDAKTQEKVLQLKKDGYACRFLRGPLYDGTQCEKNIVGTNLATVPEWTYKSEQEKFEGVKVMLSAPTQVLESIVSIDGKYRRWVVSQNVSIQLKSGRLTFKKVRYAQWGTGPLSVSFGSWPYDTMNPNEYEFEFASGTLQLIWMKSTNWYYAPEHNHYKFGIPMQRTN